MHDQGSSQTKPHGNRESLKAVWLNPEAYATTLLLCYIDAYGTEGLEWDPMTVRQEIEEDNNIKLSETNFNKLMAGINIASTDQFYKNLPEFIDLCNILSGDVLDLDGSTPQTLQSAHGVLRRPCLYHLRIMTKRIPSLKR